MLNKFDTVQNRVSNNQVDNDTPNINSSNFQNIPQVQNTMNGVPQGVLNQNASVASNNAAIVQNNPQIQNTMNGVPQGV